MNDTSESRLHQGMRLWMSLARTVTVLSQGLERALQEEVGVSGTDKILLTQLAVADGPVRMVDLAEGLMVTKAGVTHMVDRLEERGLVERRPSEEDRRVTHIVITERGRDLWSQARDVMYSYMSESLFDHLDEDEVVALRQALDRVLEAHQVLGSPDLPPG